MRYLDRNFFLQKLREMATADFILDIGGGETPAKRQFAHILGQTRVRVVDSEARFHPDVKADITALPFQDNFAPAIICTNVLQHVSDPVRATGELCRVLAPGGKIIVSVPFAWPYHGGDDVRDYYRFSEDALRLLFGSLSNMELKKSGGNAITMVNFIPIRTVREFLGPFCGLIDRIIPSRHTTPGLCLFGIK